MRQKIDINILIRVIHSKSGFHFLLILLAFGNISTRFAPFLCKILACLSIMDVVRFNISNVSTYAFDFVSKRYTTRYLVLATRVFLIVSAKEECFLFFLKVKNKLRLFWNEMSQNGAILPLRKLLFGTL